MCAVAIDPRRDLDHGIGRQVGQRAVVADIDNLDVAQMRSVMFTPDPDADLDGNGIVGPSDAIRLREALGLPPGPSGATNACSGVQSNLEAVQR